MRKEWKETSGGDIYYICQVVQSNMNMNKSHLNYGHVMQSNINMNKSDLNNGVANGFCRASTQQWILLFLLIIINLKLLLICVVHNR